MSWGWIQDPSLLTKTSAGSLPWLWLMCFQTSVTTCCTWHPGCPWLPHAEQGWRVSHGAASPHCARAVPRHHTVPFHRHSLEQGCPGEQLSAPVRGAGTANTSCSIMERGENRKRAVTHSQRSPHSAFEAAQPRTAPRSGQAVQRQSSAQWNSLHLALFVSFQFLSSLSGLPVST